jgi:serine/threonine protein kinase
MSDPPKKQKIAISLLSGLRGSSSNLVDFAETATTKTLIAQTPGAIVAKCVSPKRETFALKAMKRAEGDKEDEMLSYLYALEFKIASFLGSSLLSSACPHFCGVYAYQFSERTVDVHLAAVESPKVEPIMLMELCDMTLARYFESCAIEEEIASVVLQIVYAILCMQSVGISHNDLFARNILVSKTASASHLYCTGTTTLCLRTFGHSVRICDFGLASCYNHTDERTPLHIFYYPDNHLSRPEDVASADHPLRYSQVRMGERDFMSALAEIFRLLAFGSERLRHFSCNVRDYLLHFMDLLVQVTPRSPENGMAFARKMLDPKEIAEFMNTTSLFGTENPDCVFEVPSPPQQTLLRKHILRVLDTKVSKDVVY